MKTAQSILSAAVIILTSPIWLSVGYVKLGLFVLKGIEEGIGLAQNNINSGE
jgi:hypothetical protein